MSQTATQTIDVMVGDMIALEQHFVELLETQIGEITVDHGETAMELSRCQDLLRDHVQALLKVRRAGNPWVGGRIAGAIKSAAVIAAALEASGVDLVRSQGLPKDLRESYSMASQAVIGYVMLYVTAVALDDELVSLMAIRHLRDQARLTAALVRLMPGAIIDSMKGDHYPVRGDLLPDIQCALGGVWQSGDVRMPQLA